VAAPPIDFDKPTAIPVRVLPASPAYFTGAPKYTDQLREVEELHAKYAFLPTVPAGEAPRMAWVKLPQFRGRVGEVVPSAKYKRVIKLLQRLNRIPRSMAPPEVLKIMDKFLRPGNPYQREAPPQVLDNMGRARGVGRRKTASAQVWLVEGDGEVMINGRNIVEMFPRLHDRESALWPLKSTDRMDKYNVFALVRGGGVTGQAEAITVALGRALMVHEPALKPVLRRGTFSPSLHLIPPAVMQWIVLTSHYSRCCQDGSSTSRKEKGWSPQGQKEARLGAEMNTIFFSIYFVSHFLSSLASVPILWAARQFLYYHCRILRLSLQSSIFSPCASDIK
jgi:small subunit ribosomal protein S9